MLWPPIVLLLALRLGAPSRAGVAVVAAVGAIASAAWMAVLAVRGNVPFDDDASRLYFGTDTHASALLLGCAAAALVIVAAAARGGRARARAELDGDVVGWLALGAASSGCCSPAASSSRASTAAGSSPWPLLATVVVVAATRRGSMLGRALDVAPLRWIGCARTGSTCGTGRCSSSRGRCSTSQPVAPRSCSCRGWRSPSGSPRSRTGSSSSRSGARASGRGSARITSAGSAVEPRRPALVAGAGALGRRARVRVRPRPGGRLRGAAGARASRRVRARPEPRVPPGKTAAVTAAPGGRLPTPARVTAFGDSVLESAGRALRLRCSRSSPSMPTSAARHKRGLRRDRVAEARGQARADRRDRDGRERHRRRRRSSTTC